MAISQSAEWEVRTTGNDLNGGAFTAGASGTDYSQQDSPQKSGSDLAIHASDATKVQPVGAGVAAADVGNYLWLPGGGGFTAGAYEIKSQDGTYWTVDRAAGTVGSTSGSYRMGGAKLTLGAIIDATTGVVISGNTVHLKAGTHSLSAAVYLGTPAGLNSYADAIRIIGYQTSHRDYGTKPVLTSASAIDLFTHGRDFLFENVEFDGADVATRAINGLGDGYQMACVECLFRRFTARALDLSEMNLSLIQCEFTDMKAGSDMCVFTQQAALLLDCYFHDSPGTGARLGQSELVRSVFARMSGSGAQLAGLGSGNNAIQCAFVGNGSDGLEIGYWGVTSSVEDNLFVGNGGYGINSSFNAYTPKHLFRIRRNAFYNNTSGQVNSYLTGVPRDSIALAGDPFVDAANHDYRLNAGYGAAARGVLNRIPGVIPADWSDLGPLQGEALAALADRYAALRRGPGPRARQGVR